MKLLTNPLLITLAISWVAVFGWFVRQLWRAPVMREDARGGRLEPAGE